MVSFNDFITDADAVNISPGGDNDRSYTTGRSHADNAASQTFME